MKVYLVCAGRRLKKRKTTTKKSTLNPTYNEAIIFDIPPENVEQVSLSIMVMDYDRWVRRWGKKNPKKQKLNDKGRLPFE